MDESQNAQLKQKANAQVANASDILQKIQGRLLKQGAASFKRLSRYFRIMDDDRSHTINLDEFITGMHDMGFDVTPAEGKALFQEFDRDGNGTLDVTEFTVTLRPKMNAKRRDIVNQCFAKMDKTGDGIITVEDLAETYSVKEHPKFKSGEWSRAKILRLFLDTFDAADQTDGQVTIDEFMSYYSCLSASIDNDMYFILMMRNAWGLN